MSKNKGKDKKNQATSLIQKQLQAQKRDIIDHEFVIKKLQQRLAEKTQQNYQLAKELEQMHLVDKQKIKILSLQVEADQQKFTTQMNKNTQLQIKLAKQQSLKKCYEDQLMFQKQSRQKQAAQFKIRMENQRAKFKMEIQNLQIYAQNRQKNQQELLNLKQKIQYERSQKTRQLADKEREKVQATDKLRDQMLKKIRQMKTNLLSLKKQQLSTTTRLTILQNHQLTSQLQYQSKQTEKLIFKQEQMQQKIKQLTQQLAIHKQVEEQLAKRAHFSKGVIKKLNDRVSELEKQLENNKNSRTIESGKNISHLNSGTKSKLYIQAPQQTNNKEMFAQIQKQLQNTQKKYSQLQSKLKATQKQRDSLSNQVRRFQNSCNQLSSMLIRFSEQYLSKKTQTCTQNTSELDPVLKIQLNQLRARQVSEWNQQQTSFVVKVLLNLVKPYLTKKNVLIPAIRRLLIVQDTRLGKSQSKLPKITQGQQNNVKGLRDLPTNIASKIVGSNLRQWGNTVNLANQNAILKKKYKISQSQR